MSSNTHPLIVTHGFLVDPRRGLAAHPAHEPGVPGEAAAAGFTPSGRNERFAEGWVLEM